MEYIWNWLRGTVEFLLPFMKRKKSTIVFLGLANAGKTTLMGRIKSGRAIQAPPTLHAHSETLSLGNLTFTAYDLGGHDQVLRVWKTYTCLADGIVFMIDGLDRKIMPKSRRELDGLLQDEELANIPIAVLVNKIDEYGAAGVEEIEHFYYLKDVRSGKGKSPKPGKRPLEIFPCSVLREQGYGDAFRWLADNINATDES